MKRGQVMGQPIVYLFYVIVAILVLTLGTKWIINIGDQSSDAEYVVFMNKLDSKIDKIASYNSGSVMLLDELNIPSSVKEVCFVDWSLDQTPGDVVDETLSGYIAAVDGGEKNVFFAGEEMKGLGSSFSLFTSPLCDSTLDGVLDMKLVKEGSFVFVKSI